MRVEAIDAMDCLRLNSGSRPRLEPGLKGQVR